MSDQQVDLNAMIQYDRKRKHIHKQRQRDQWHHDRFNQRDSYHRSDRRDDRIDDRRDDRRDRNSKPRYQSTNKNEVIIQTCAIGTEGFVSDVSLEDILNLAKGKQIINIKASLSRQDGQPLVPGQDTAMNVIINFVDKKQADQFIKQYADKKLDGKNAMQFQFKRGITVKQQKKQESQIIEAVNEKSQQEDN